MKIKAFSFVFVLLTLLFTTGCGSDNTPKLGEQYQTLPVDLSEYNLAPVTEVFSLTCGHCRSMESVIPQLETLTSEPIGKVHVTFNESARVAAMMYYTAEMQLGGTPPHDFMEELFAAVQLNDGSTLEEKQVAIENVYKKYDIASPYQLDKEQQTALFALVAKASEISVKGQINSVPTFIVGGKYMILTSGHSSVEAMAETINYLNAQQ
ncbi:thioredoxin domain-containing protein [Vibrio sonorensis]|uniref:thioredoxin domain-containing protein n=1 Tax=Vibrio sonorensis TaxID=1004316 RepID=UPI0008D9175E|nr:thioredoxin domain-containing protein [Vibrio sonorensis]